MSSVQTVRDDVSIAFDPNNLTPAEQLEIEKLKSSIKVEDGNSLLQYGVDSQKELSRFAETLLNQVRSKDTGPIGEALADLSIQVKKVDTRAFMASQSNFLAGIPGIGYFFNQLERFKAQYSTIEENINRIVDKLESQYQMLLRDVVIFDELYKQNIKYFRSLDMIIYAGEQKTQDLENDLSMMEAKYKESKDDLMFQKIENTRSFMNQFEIKVNDLKLTRISTLQSFPQINVVKVGDQGLAAKVQSAVLNTIPLWKRQVTIAIGLYNQKQVLNDLERVDQTTNDLLLKNAEMMKENMTGVARTMQRGIISIETLEKVQKQLIDGIDEVRKIVVDGKKQRVVAESKMMELEHELKDKIADVTSEKLS